MILTAIVAGSLACYTGLVVVPDRKKGVSISQVGIAIGAILLFVSMPNAETTIALSSSIDPIMAMGTGVFSATAAAMGFHLYLGRFASIRVARGVFLIVGIGIAVSFLTFLKVTGQAS